MDDEREQHDGGGSEERDGAPGRFTEADQDADAPGRQSAQKGGRRRAGRFTDSDSDSRTPGQQRPEKDSGARPGRFTDSDADPDTPGQQNPGG